jgi:hypothetical protein
MPFTAEAIVLISHFQVRPGHAHLLRGQWDPITFLLESSKPRTAGWIGYLSEGGGDLTIVQVFEDARAMMSHMLRGDHTRPLYEHVDPDGWEVYGPAPEELLGQLGEQALAAGVNLTIQPKTLGGFLRTGVR